MRFVVLLALIGLAEAFTATSTLPSLRRPVAMSTCASGGLSMTGGDMPEKAALKTGKTWGARTFVREHVTLASQLPAYLAAYVGPKAALEPKLTEAIMLTLNSIDTCPYCTGLHGELARMAGTDPATYESPCIKYAEVLAENQGRGAAVEEAFGKLQEEEGAARARSAKALCWMLLWGKTTGNTINLARDRVLSLKLTQLRPIDALVVAFYAPLFIVIALLNAALSIMPPIPPKASAALGAVLWVPQALHVGLLGALCLPLKFLLGLVGVAGFRKS